MLLDSIERREGGHEQRGLPNFLPGSRFLEGDGCVCVYVHDVSPSCPVCSGSNGLARRNSAGNSPNLYWVNADTRQQFADSCSRPVFEHFVERVESE